VPVKHFAFAVFAFIFGFAWAGLGNAQEMVVVRNPYADVDWDRTHHKSNFHTHTTESDGSHEPGE
jgi:hypothetical protein